MPEQTPKNLSHFGSFRFSPDYYQLKSVERKQLHADWLAGLRQASARMDVYATYPAQTTSDVMVWSAVALEESCSVQSFFDRYAWATNPYRQYIEPDHVQGGV